MRRRALLATALLLWGLSGPARAADPAGAMVLGARMMALMWDAMLWFFSDGGGRDAYGGWPTTFGYPAPYAGSPWSGGVPGYGAWPYGASPYGGPGYAQWGRGPLQGVWLTNAGEYLWVSGPRFRLATRRGALSGWLQVRGNLVRAWLSNGAVQQYRFMRQGNLLVMKDPFGQTLLLRRIR